MQNEFPHRARVALVCTGGAILCHRKTVGIFRCNLGFAYFISFSNLRVAPKTSL